MSYFFCLFCILFGRSFMKCISRGEAGLPQESVTLRWTLTGPATANTMYLCIYGMHSLSIENYAHCIALKDADNINLIWRCISISICKISTSVSASASVCASVCASFFVSVSSLASAVISLAFYLSLYRGDQCFWSSQEISIFIFAFCKNASSKWTPVATAKKLRETDLQRTFTALNDL